MQARIQLKCECCGETHDLKKSEEIPTHVFFMHCNFCLWCEDKMTDYYHEWWDDNENPESGPPIPEDPNQLCFPFILEEIGVKHYELETQNL